MSLPIFDFRFSVKTMGGFGNTLGLLFEINADPSKAQAALAAFTGSLERRLGFAQGSLGQFANAGKAAARDLLYMGGVAAGLAAGAVALANKWAEAGTEIFEASEQTGLAADKLSGLFATAKVLDESTQSLTVSLARMGRNITSGIAKPSSAAGKTLQSLFKNSEELRTLGLKPLDAQVVEVTKRIFALSSVSEQYIALNNTIGRGYTEIRSTMAELAKGGYDPLIQRASLSRCSNPRCRTGMKPPSRRLSA